MSGESTGRDLSPSSFPESAGKAPMPSAEHADPTGKSLRMLIVAFGFQKCSVANSPGSVNPGPESPPDLPATDAAETQEANAGASSQQASSSAAPDSNPPEATGGSGTPKKRHLSIPIPSRRSSKADKQSTMEKTEEPTQEESSRRGSKVSMLRVRRERSRASSRRSRRTEDVANAEKAQDTNTPSTTEMNGPSKPQQKKSSKLLSFLSCCSSSDVDGDDSALPPKRTTMRPPASNRLPTPDKAEAHAGDSSTAESRDPTYLDEKANMSVTADQEEERTAAAEAQGEGTSAAVGSSDAPPTSSKDREGAVGMANGVTSESTAETHRTDEKAAASEEPAATEPTSEKAKAVESQETSHQEDVVQAPAVLPPPPPPPAPEIPSDAGEQQWLLPPPLPHMQNRKCLVLDLDETLVHSSFKVSRARLKGLNVSTHFCLRSLSVPISPSQWRLKDSIITSMSSSGLVWISS